MATLVNTGTAADVIYTLPATTSTAFLEDDGTSGNGTLQLRSSNGTFTTTVFANPMGSLTINRGSASDTITLNGLPDFTAALTIGASTSPFSSMTFAGGMTLGLNKSLVAYASGTIATSGSTAKVTTSGSGAVSLTTARDIQLNTGASITTVNGSITLLANQQTPSTAGDFIGLYIDGAVVQASGTGAVNASGKGGNASNVVQYGVDIVRGSAVTGGSGGLQISGLGGDSPTGTNHGVVVDAGSQISAAGTGSVTIQGTGGSGGDRNYGISLRATGTLVTSSGGNVQVTGQAGAGASTGVEINTSAQVSAGGNGTVTVLGTGGTGASPGNPGVEIVTGSISSGGGNVTVTGHGGGTGTSSNNDGVLISAAQVTAGKTGKVTVTGTGGGGSGSGNPGVVVQGTNTAVTSSGGDVQVTGMGGGTGSSSQNYGIEVAGSAQISAGGSGAVTLQGTAGLGSGTLNYGVSLQGSSPTITSGGGTIQVTGIEGTATTARGLDLNGGTITTAVNGGSITLVANSVSISVLSAVSANSTGSVTIKPFTTGVAVNLGTSTDPISGPLNLTPTEFGRITAGTIDIGDANSGAITVTADITRAASTAMNLTSGGAISFTGGQVNTAGGNLSLSPGSAASVGVAKTGTDVSMSSTGTLSFAAGSDLAIAIDGKTVDTQYQQLNVIGSVDLTGADLALSGSYTPLQGDRFVLVNNDGTDPITGTFTGLPEGQAFAIASGALAGTYQITYRGGDGNDVVLALANPDQVLQGTSGDDVWLVSRNGNNVDVTLNGAGLLSQPYTSLTTLTINGLAGNDTLNVDLSAGNAIPSGGAFFIGGDPTTGPGDKLTITGGSQGTVTYNYVNANDGSIVMSNFGTIDYTGLEPITNSGTASDMVFNLPAGTNAATLGDDGTTGNGISRLGAATFETTNFTNPTNSLTINPGGAADTITVNAVPDLHATLTIGSSASPFSSIGFTGAISLTGSHNLGATAAKSISLSASATLGTAAGSISLSSNQGTMASSGNFIGIDIAGGAVRSISGSISLAGRGGTGGIGIGNQIGVYIHGLGIVGDATTGTVTVTGTGGTTPTGSLGGNAGIELDESSAIESGGGSVIVTGAGGADADGHGGDHGVYLPNGAINAAGGGTLTVTGSAPATVNDIGVDVEGGADALKTVGGKMAITGTGGHGVVFSNTVVSAHADIDITGTATGIVVGTNVNGFELSGNINTFDAGNITLTADSINLGGTIDAETRRVTLAPKTNGWALNLGGDDSPTQLGLRDFEIPSVVAGTINIGDANSGPITVSADILRAAPTAMNLISGGAINFSGGLVDTDGGNLTITPGSVAAARFGKSGTDAKVDTTMNHGAVIFGSGSDVLFTINGATADSQYERLNVTGNVTLTGSDLVVGGSYTPTSADSFAIVKYSGARTGKFNNSSVTLNGAPLQVVYDDAHQQVLLTAPAPGTLSATLDGLGNLTIADVDATGKDNDLTISTSSGNLVVSDANETFISAPAGGTLSNANKTLTIPLTSVSSSLTINAAGGNDTITTSAAAAFAAALTINGGTGNDTINLNSSMSLAANHSLDVNLQDDDASPGVDAIFVGLGTKMTLDGSGAATLKASKSVYFGSGSSVATSNGNIVIEANQQTTPNAGSFAGIEIDGGAVQAIGSGTVSLMGKGGAAPVTNQYGVYIHGANALVQGGSGSGTTTSIQGMGGAGAFGSNFGVYINDSNLVTSLGGNVSVVGTGGTAGDVLNHGVVVDNFSQISAGGSGTVSVIGQGGTGTGGSHFGVLVRGAGSMIGSSGGDVSVTGTGGSGGGGDVGVYVFSTATPAQITASGGGLVSVRGIGGTGDSGVLVSDSGGRITSSGGAIVVTGVGGSGGGNAITLQTGGTISSVSNAPVTLVGDSMSLDGTAVVSAGTGTVVLRQNSQGTLINLGGPDVLSGGPLALGLTDAELDRITAGAINIGDANSGAITISAAIDRGAGSTTAINLMTGGNNSIGFTGSASVNAKNGNVALLTDLSRSGSITGGNAANDVIGANVSFTAGSGGIGTSGNPLAFAATNVNATTGGNGNQFLSASGSTTIDATGLSAGTGTVELDGGAFTLGGSDRVNDSTRLLVNGATFSLGTFNDTVGALTLLSGSVTGTGGVLTSGSTIQTQSGAISAILAGSVGLTQTTTGTTTLRGANTYSGDTTISNGTLKLGASNVIPNGTGNGNVVLNPASGTATFDVAGFNETINGLSSSGAGSSIVDNSLAGGPFTLTVGGNDATSTFAGIIQNTAGTLALTKSGVGTVTLSGANTYSGTTTISAGSLRIGNGGSTGSLGTGNVIDNGTLVFNRTVNYPVANAISGSGGVTISMGQVDFTAANTYTGTTLVSGGSLFLGLGTATGSLSSSSAIIDNATFGSQRTNTITQGIDFASLISGTGSVLEASASGGNLVLNGLNTYTGTTTVSGGTITVNSIKNVGGGPSALGAPASVANGTIGVGTTGNAPPALVSKLVYTGAGDTTDRVVNLRDTVSNGATLDQSGTGLLKFTSAFTTTGASAKTLTLQGSTSATGEIAGAIVDNSATNTTSIVKAGTGAWTLSGANTYTGATTISGGTLALSGAFTNNLSGTPTIDVQTGAGLNVTGLTSSTLVLASGQTLKGVGTVTGKLNAASGSTISPGESPGILNTGDVTLNSGSNLNIELNGTTVGTQYDQDNVTGAVSLGGATLNLTLGFTPAVGSTFTIINNDSTDAVTGTFSGLPEGAVFTRTTGSFSGTFQISYQGGSGNDVVLAAVNAASPSLPGTSGDDNWLVNRNGANVDVTLNGTVIWSPAYASLSSLTINGGIGADTLTVDSSAGDPFPSGGITFHGGNSTGDKVITTGVPGGGNYTTITNNYTSTGPGHSGTIIFIGSQTDTLTYDGIAPIDMSGSVATDLIFNLPPTASNAFLEEDGTPGNGKAQLRSGNGTFETTVFANPSGSVTISRGNAADTLAVNNVGSTDFNAGLTIGTAGSEFSSVAFAGGITLAANKSLSANATGTISLGAITVSGTGTVNLTTARNIFISSISSITSVDGAINLVANQQSTPTSGSFAGVKIDGGSVEATGAGKLTIQGTGGNGTASYGVEVDSGGLIKGGSGGVQILGTGGGTSSTSDNDGVLVFSAGSITARDDGSVIVQGTGGAGQLSDGVSILGAGSAITSSGGNVQVTGHGGGSALSVSSDGVRIGSLGQLKAGGSGSLTVQGTGGVGSAGNCNGIEMSGDAAIQSNGGDVSVAGQGGGSTASSTNIGVYVPSGKITAGGSGTLTVQATGGPGSGNQNHGIEFTGNSSDVVTVGSSGGAVQITGTGGGSGTSSSSEGVRVLAFVSIQAGASGILTVQGNGGTGSGNGNVGIDFPLGGSSISSSGGNIQITGVEGGGTSGIGISGAIVAAANGGAIILASNSMNLDVGSNISTSATGGVTLKQFDGGVGVIMGSASDPVGGPLSLTDAELDRVTAGMITIGDATTGPITISAPIDRPAGSTTAINLTTETNRNIAFTGNGSLDAKNGNVTLLTNSSGTGAITSGTAAVDVSGANIGLTAGSGGIGASGNPLVVSATSLNATTGGNGNQFLSASGSTTIDAGGLSAGSGAIEFDGGTFELGGPNRMGSNSTIVVRTATLALGTNDQTVGGVMILSGGGSITGPGTLTSKTTFQAWMGSISAVLAGIDNTVGLIKDTPGSLTLSGENIYSGDTTIILGSLRLGANEVLPDGLGKGNVVFNPAGGDAVLAMGGFSETINGLTNSGAGNSVVTNSASNVAITLTVGNNDQSGAFSGVIEGGAGTLSVRKIGTGTLTLSGSNTYAGDTTISNGTLKLGADNVIPDGTIKGNVVLNPAAGNTATLDLGGFSETINGLSASGGSNSVIDNSVSGGPFTLSVGGNNQSSSFGGVIKNTAGTLALTKIGAGTLTLSAPNAYSGDTTISQGSVVLGSSLAVPSGPGKGNVVFNPASGTATLDLNGKFLAINGLSSSGAGASVVDNSAFGSVFFNVGRNDQTTTFGGSVKNTGGSVFLEKEGAGTLTLTGTNTNSRIDISGGKVIVNGSATQVNVSNPGTLGGVGTTGPVLVQGPTAHLAPGVTAAGVLATGNVTFNGGDFDVDLNGTTVGSEYDQEDVTGTVSLGFSPLNVKLGYSPAIGDSFRIIKNDGIDFVSSIFRSLPEGTVFGVTSGSFSADLQISYHSGDGNDVVLTAINVPPTLDPIADQTIAEDAPQQTINLTGITSGGALAQNVSITATSDQPAIIPDPVVIYSSADSTGSLKFQPLADQNGLVTITVTVQDDGDTAAGSNTFIQTFTVRVTNVNDAPSFVKGDDQAATDENPATHGPAPSIVVHGWATNMAPGPANATDEAGQALSFTVTTDNDDLFAVKPAVDPLTGDLIYTIAPNANGTAHVRVVIHDDGGTANGGVDASGGQVFDIVVTKPHIWHNTKNPLDVVANPPPPGLDVNDDGHVAANDVVAIVNYINGFGKLNDGRVPPLGSPLPNGLGVAGIGKPFGFLDVNADDFVAANDALAIVNVINAGQAGGEGEAVPGDPASHDADLMTLLAVDVALQAKRRR